DPRSDIWSLGVVFYEMLTAARPFPGPDELVSNAILTGKSVPLDRLRQDLPPDLTRIISRMLQKDSRERYSSATELLNDLKNCRVTLTKQYFDSALRAPTLGNSI